MDKLRQNLDSRSSSANDLNQQKAQRKLSVERCILSLINACKCRDDNCQLPSCLKLKKVVAHTKICKQKTNGRCPICKELIALCCYHAKHCQMTKCFVPYCCSIRQKLKQRLQHSLQQAQSIRTPVVHQQTLPQQQQQGPAEEQKRFVQQLLQTMKNPLTSEQQNEILQMLESNSLIAAFCKQRQMGQHALMMPD